MELTRWAIDPSHSEVQFKVKHLVITTVTGSFDDFTGEVEASENFEEINLNFTTKTSSINTKNEQRDIHLKSADFFDAENFPEITFKSNGNLTKQGANLQLIGDLTLKGITKTVTLTVNYEGKATDPYGNVKAGFEVSGKINRSEFGLTWSALTEAGGAVVSDEIRIIANIQLVRVA
jgi:polyisoprenoid-binding protein YceI